MSTMFRFAFDPRFAPLLRLGGITPGRAWLRLDDRELVVRFGLLTLTTPRSNLRAAQVTGPHRPVRAIGVRMSLADRGLTFGTSVERTTCIEFVQPVRVRPLDITGHPGLTVSVEDPDGLAALVNGVR